MNLDFKLTQIVTAHVVPNARFAVDVRDIRYVRPIDETCEQGGAGGLS